jgi:hypothetical protein
MYVYNIIISMEVDMKYRRFLVSFVFLSCIGFSQEMWIETSREDFQDGFFERNLFASHHGGGALEFVPRYDLNNDGYIDLFTADAGGPNVRIHWGGVSGYLTNTTFSTGGADNCDAADLNADGHADFIVSHRNSPKITIYWGSPSGPSQTDQFSLNTVTTARQGVFVADFDKDGYLDIATGQQMVNGYGTVFWGSSSGYSTVNRTDLPVAWGVHNIEVADFNKDNWLDILYVNTDYQDNTIYWGSGSGYAASNHTLLDGPYYSHGASVADLDNDTYLDLIFTAWESGQSYIYWGSASGYSSVNMQILNTGPCFGGSAVVDLNSDNYLDILFHRGGYGNHQQEIFWGSASGYSENDTSNIGVAITATGGLIADFDQDGDLDIFCNNYNPTSYSHIFWGPDYASYATLPANYDHHAMFREIGNVYDRGYSEPYISSVFDAAETADWGAVQWEDSLPAGTSISFAVRTGDTPSHDPSWSDWCVLSNGGEVPDSLDSRYVQYMLSFDYTNPAYFPCVFEVRIYYSTAPFTLISPNGGECWMRGNFYEISWNSGVGGDAKIELYKGGTFNSVITNSASNNGSYNWSIPSGQLPGVDYKVKVSSVSDPGLYGFSDDDFSICSQLVLSAPNGGEIWHIGESYDITWATSGIGGNVLLEYSIDAGSTWDTIIAATPDDGIFGWNIPSTPTTLGRVRVSHESCPANCDESDADFTITEYAITVTQPNGGECWIRGTVNEITWAAIGISGNIKIELYKAGILHSTITDSTANDGAYDWNVPPGQLPGFDYRVKILSVSDPLLADLSDDDFGICSQLLLTAPIGGETWYIGQDHEITWAQSGIGGNVFIEYTTNAGSSWLVVEANAPDTGIHVWHVPNTPTNEGRVKITHLACTQNIDISDSNFTITQSSVFEHDLGQMRPARFALDQNRPNPCGRLTEIGFALPSACHVEIKLFDITGKEIAMLMDGDLDCGYYQKHIDASSVDGRALPSGVYFYRLTAGDFVATRSMTVLR